MRRLVLTISMVIGLALAAPSAFADDSPNPPTPSAPTAPSSAPADSPAAKSSSGQAAIACNAEEFCVSKDTNFNGATFKFKLANTNWSFTSYADLYNEDSSWRSRWDVPVNVYDLTQYGGGVTQCVNTNWDVYNNPANSDRGSSHKWNGISQC